MVTSTRAEDGMPIVEHKGIVSTASIHRVNVGRDSRATGRALGVRVS